MFKEDNEWEIGLKIDEIGQRSVEINQTYYRVENDMACLVHSILLLVDAINDKKLIR